MSDLSNFGATAKGLAKNPLGIIALFIVLIYGFAALTLSGNSNLQINERWPLVWFLVLFPVAVLILFGWLVGYHHEKLYAPSDFRSDDIFLKKSEFNERRKVELIEDNKKNNEKLKNRVREVIIEELTKTKSEPEEIADRVAKEVEDATTLVIDARAFLKRADALFVYPFSEFEILSDLTNEIYFRLVPHVHPYQYGFTWLLRNKNSSKSITTLRMLVGAPPGKPFPDKRSLQEVGISPGDTLVVERP